MISLKFTLGRDDMLAFSRNYYENSPTACRAIRRAQVVFPIIMIIASAYYFYRDGGWTPVIFVIFGILWAIFYPKRMRYNMLKTTEKMLKESSHERSFGDYQLNFTEDGISSVSPTGESHFKWSSVDQIRMSDTHLNIFLSGPMGYPIPRSQISDDLISEVRNFTEARINKTEQD